MNFIVSDFSHETAVGFLQANISNIEQRSKPVRSAEAALSAAAPGQGRLFHLHKIYLLPEAQGGGNGKRLFMAGEREMRLAGATAFELNVNRGNPALEFYRHLGMQLSRSGDFDIGGGFFMNDHILRKELL